MKPLTVKDILNVCLLEVKKGNGNKTVMISNDDEGNGYHYVWYTFSSVEDAMDEDQIDMYVEENVAKKEDTIVLG